MTMLRVSGIFLAISFLVSSCDNELQTAGDFVETPVVYAMLNWQDAAHYVRVERAFIDKTTGATTLAADPAAIYFPNATVSLQKINNKTNAVVQTTFMTKVDGATEGYPRMAGVFATTPNYIYKTTEVLDTATYGVTVNNDRKRTALYRYGIKIYNDDSKKTYTAETRLINYFLLDLPAANTVQQWIPVAQNPKLRVFKLNAPESAAVFDIDLHFEYTERQGAGSFQPKTFIWKMARNLRAIDENGTNVLTYKVDPVELYNVLNANLSKVVDPTQLVRCGTSLKYRAYVYAAGSDYANYTQFTSELSGVSSSDVLPQYSNVKDGRGFMSSRCLYKSDAFVFAKETVDSIALSYRTSKLNFTTWNSSVCN